MKRYLFVWAFAMMLLPLSCSKEQATGSDSVQTDSAGPSEEKPAEQPKEGYHTVGLAFNIGEDLVDETKAAVSDVGVFTWTTGDKIAVSAYNVSTGEYTMLPFTCKEGGSKEGHFEAEVPDGYLTYGWAVFPYDEGHSYNGTELVVNFPESVSYSTPTPMMYASLDDCQFQHIGSLVKVTYNYAPAGTNKLVASASGIAGTYTVNTADNSISAKSTSNTATYNFWTITGIETKIVYIMLPYGTKTLGVCLKQGDSTVDDSSKTGASHEYKKGFLTKLPAISLPKFTDVFLLGDGFECGWNRDDNNYKMSKSERVYTWTGLMQKGQDFRFTVNNGDWWPSIRPYEREGESWTDDTWCSYIYYGDDLPDATGNDKHFRVNKDGNYTITIDATDDAALKYKIKLNEEIPTPLYIVGDATEKGWIESADPDFAMTADRDAGFLHYCWTGDMTGSGSFKFLTEAGTWDKIWNRGGTVGTDWFNLAWRETSPTGDEDMNFTVENKGNFTVTCDMANKKLLVKPNRISTIYLVGGAVNAEGSYTDEGVWTTKDFPLNETADGSGIYTNTSPYTLKQDNFRFSLEPGKAGGWYRNPAVVWGTLFSIYDMIANDYMFYNVTAGNYTITVNTHTMKVTMTLNE